MDNNPGAAASVLNLKRESSNGDGDNNNRGIISIAERRAAKCGFQMKKTERINTARFRTTSPLTSPSPTSCIIIPPGISPTALLDSPIMLPNSHGQPSPTTGTFPSSLPLKYESLLLKGVGCCGDGERGSSNTSGLSFRFKPYGHGDSLPCFSTKGNQGNGFDFEANLLMNPSMDFQFPVEFSEEATPEKCTCSSSSHTDVNFLDSMIGNANGNGFDFEANLLMNPSMDFQFPVEFSEEATPEKCTSSSHTDVNFLDSMIRNANVSDMQICSSDLPSNPISIQSKTIHEENIELHHLLEEPKGTLPATAIGRTSDDGYNWRKYGQKQVKGSEYPRSYYKCTHANCLVKKKIERAHDGQITEIIYKGTHNHPQPQPRRGAPPGPASSLYEMPEMGEGGNSVKVEGGSVQKNRESGSKDMKVHSDWKVDGLERTSSTSVVTELSDLLSTTQVRSIGTFESIETPELSSTLASHDDDDGVTQGSSFIVDADDESESKRRKMESCLVETNMASKLAREPRVVVQIESEVDILDDGYRWRKYGQKVVKGNPNPRSYYKCTSPGCSVRKHVERASHDLKYVITTYEGKHNHEVPAARNSSRGYSAGSNLSQTTGDAQPALALARTTKAPNPKAQVQEFAPSFDRKSVFNNDYLRSNFPGNFSNEMNLGSSSICPMKFPAIQNTMPYDSFGFNNHHLAANHSGSVASLVPDFPRSLSPCLQTAANLSLARVDFSSHGKPVGQVQTFLQGQQLIRPKQELKDDSLYGASPPIMHNLNAASSSLSVYHRLLGNFLS